MGQKGATSMELIQRSHNHILTSPSLERSPRAGHFAALPPRVPPTALGCRVSETGTGRPAPQCPLPEVAGGGKAAAERPNPPGRRGSLAAAGDSDADPGSRYLGSGRTILLLARAAGVALLFSIAIK